MTWFKVDDKFWSHQKVMLASLEATGLWVRAGAWCAMHLTDGYIPAEILRRISPERPRKTDQLAQELVDFGLWIAQDGGWLFHEWSDHQPTKEKVEAERERNRKRQEDWYSKRKRGSVTDLGEVRSKKSHGGSNGVRNGVSNKAPTRPDPTIETAPEGSAVSMCPHGEPRGAAACPLCRRQIGEAQ